MRYLIWNYPQEDGTVGREKRTEAEAIAYQREYAFKKHDFVYENDQQALDSVQYDLDEVTLERMKHEREKI